MKFEERPVDEGKFWSQTAAEATKRTRSPIAPRSVRLPRGSWHRAAAELRSVPADPPTRAQFGVTLLERNSGNVRLTDASDGINYEGCEAARSGR